jgi:hypothetical protein
MSVKIPADMVGMPEDVVIELLDVRFVNRTHASRATYAIGCHGPLCRKAERDRGRPRQRAAKEAEGRTVIPRDELHPSRVRDDLLDKIILWHRHKRGLDPIESATA